MKQFFLLLCTISLMVLSLTTSWAQCPSADSYVTTTTVASCPSNGVIQLSNPADAPVTGGQGVPGAVYTITAGPASGGYQTTGQSANRFEGLPPGNYSVTIVKPDCPDVVITGVVVGSTYAPLSLSATVANVCANGQPGAVISATATGGLAPIQYAFAQAPNANIDDNLLTYSSASSTQTTASGLFQVRAKDGCGVFTTNTVDVEPISQRAYLNPNASVKNCQEYTINGILTSSVNYANLNGSFTGPYTLEFFDITSTDPCGIPAGATPFQTITANSAADLTFDLAVTHGRFAVRTTSPCGEVDTQCYDLANSLKPIIAFRTAPSCQPINGTNGTDLQLRTYRFLGPGTITISSASPGNAVLATSSFESSASESGYGVLFPVPYDPQGYTVQVTDACGVPYSFTVTTPPGAGDAIQASVRTDLYCPSQIGDKRTIINVSGGAIGLFEAGSAVNIVAGPSGPITPAIQATPNGELDSYVVGNLAPGTYTAQISTTATNCGPTSFTFAVPVNSPSSPGLTYGLTGSVLAFCGGTGNLTTSFNYNGYGSVNYTVSNSSNVVIATNTTGVLINLPADTYTVTASATDGCSPTFTQTQTYTIPGPNSVPVIEKKVGIICENGSTLAATGQAIFRFSGFSPYQFEVSPAGTNSWSTVATGITTPDYVVSDLAANATYDFRLTDNCGKSTVTTVSIKPLEAQTVENTVNPCNGQNYTLSAPDFPGATYSWTKDGNPISTNREIAFTPFQPTNNGQYVVTITLPKGCVVRTATVTLNSSQCGQELPVHLVSFTAKVLAGQSVQLDWVTSWEKDNASFQVERSKELVHFEVIGQVAAGEGKSGGTSYQYIDQQPYPGTSYYRLRQVDQGGASTTYPAVAVVLRGEHYGVYPNPVVDARFTVSLDEPETALIYLYGGDGRQLSLKRSALSATKVELSVSQKLSAGVYTLVVEERAQKRTYHVVVQK